MGNKSPLMPTLAGLLADHGVSLATGIFSALPGQIESYSAKSTTATVSVMMQYVENTLLGDASPVKNYPLLVDVPVLQLSGGTGGVNLPIAVGDPCLVIFADRDIDNWFATGSAQVPNSSRVHSLADGFAIVGFRPKTGEISRPDYLATSLYQDATQISIKGNKVALKNGSTDLLTLLNAFCDAVISAVNSVSATTTATVSSGPPGSVSVSKDTSTVTTAKNNLINLLYTGDVTTPP